MERTDFINKALRKFRGKLMFEFYFINDDYPSFPYYYNENDDCLHCDKVSVPFHYKEEDINNSLIDECLEKLQYKLMDYYHENGIELYEYD